MSHFLRHHFLWCHTNEQLKWISTPCQHKIPQIFSLFLFSSCHLCAVFFVRGQKKKKSHFLTHPRTLHQYWSTCVERSAGNWALCWELSVRSPPSCWRFGSSAGQQPRRIVDKAAELVGQVSVVFRKKAAHFHTQQVFGQVLHDGSCIADMPVNQSFN